jgi:hypothetical protein
MVSAVYTNIPYHLKQATHSGTKRHKKKQIEQKKINQNKVVNHKKNSREKLASKSAPKQLCKK